MTAPDIDDLAKPLRNWSAGIDALRHAVKELGTDSEEGHLLQWLVGSMERDYVDASDWLYAAREANDAPRATGPVAIT